MEAYPSMWDEEQKKRNQDTREQRRLKNSELTGLKTHVPLVLCGVKIKPKGTDPVMILKSAGYVKNFDRGWIRPVDATHRFHAYVNSDGKIMVHSDLIRGKRHIASNENCKAEKMRIKNFIPIMEVDKELGKKTGYHNKKETLPLADQKRLMAELKERREIELNNKT